MIKKRVNKINWHGSDLENNRAKAPNISTPGGNGLDGLNDGEIYVCNADEDPAIFIKTNKDKVARVGGNGSDSYSRDQIDDFLRKKLDKVVWDRNLEERVDDNGEEYLFLTKPLVTAYGVTMYAGADVQVPSIYEGLPIDGVTIQWVDGKLVSTGGKGTANGIVVNGNTYTPNEDGIITLPNYPTSLEWGNISGKPSWIGSTKPSYSWDEIGGKPEWIEDTKPTYNFSEIQNKPTTIADYGITDAYTKNEISGLLADYVTKSGAQDITGVKSFINGLNIGDILVKKHSDGVVELDGDLILTGSLTMFAQGSHTASTILDALPIDNTTLSKEGGVLSVIGGVGGGSVDGIILNGTTYSPDETTKLITLPNYPTTLPASDVYSWAKQPNKPSYSFDELSSHPTTLSGYGITDAVTIDTHQQIYGTKEFRQTVFIDTQSDVKLIMRDDDNHALIGAANSEGSVLSRLGYYGDRWGIDGYKILTTNNYSAELDNRYVNKAGDTMTGTLLMSNDSDIYGRSSANSGAAYIIGYRDATISGIVMHDISAANNTKALYIQTNGYDAPSDTGGLAITNDCVTVFGAGDNGSVFRVLNEDDVNLGALFNVAKDGTLTRLGNRIWDAGNDGSGSGLDADLLDGYHYYSFESYHKVSIDTTGLDNNTWYPVTMGIDNSLQTRIRVQGNTYAPGSWNGRKDKRMALILDYTVNGSYWGWTSARRVINEIQDGAGAQGAHCIGGLGQLTNSSTEYVYVRGGAVYDFYVDRFTNPVLRTSTYTINDQSVSPQTSYSDVNRTNALLTDNVASATKLQTPRTIFSKPFDGTNNVTGGAKFNSICIETDNNGNDNGRGSEINNYNAELNLQYNTSRDITMCFGGGNVRIGTGISSYKLNVNGDTYCSGKITSGNWIRSDLYSAGIYHHADDSYSAAYNACAPNNDNYCCYSIVRSGIYAFGIGFNTNNEIWLGSADSNRKAAAQWLQISGSQVTCSGDILAYGGVTMYGSDETKKNIIERFILPLDYVVNAPLWRYTWRDNRNDRINIGGSAQYTQLMMNELVGDSDKGLTMDYATTAYAFSVSIAKHFQRFLIEDFGRHETEIERLKRENEELKNRVSELERRAA